MSIYSKNDFDIKILIENIIEINLCLYYNGMNIVRIRQLK